MPKAKNTELDEAVKTGMYKGYEVNWLRQEPSHPDYYLVAEFDALTAPKAEEGNNE